MLSARRTSDPGRSPTSVPVTTPTRRRPGHPAAVVPAPRPAPGRRRQRPQSTSVTQCSVPAGGRPSRVPAAASRPAGAARRAGPARRAATAGPRQARRNDCTTSNSSATSSRRPQLPSLAAARVADVLPRRELRGGRRGRSRPGPTRDDPCLPPPCAKNACTASGQQSRASGRRRDVGRVDDPAEAARRNPTSWSPHGQVHRPAQATPTNPATSRRTGAAASAAAPGRVDPGRAEPASRDGRRRS